MLAIIMNERNQSIGVKRQGSGMRQPGLNPDIPLTCCDLRQLASIFWDSVSSSVIKMSIMMTTILGGCSEV